MNYRIHRIARLKELVQQVIKDREEGKPKDVVILKFKNLSMNLGKDTVVSIPDSAVKLDGTIDFVFSFKALAPGDTKGAANTGVNAVFVTSYVQEKGSFAHTEMFGNTAFINRSIESVLSYLKDKYPSITLSRGKVGLVGWSGGGGPITRLLNSGFKPNSVVILDGLHSNKDPETAEKQLKAVKEFAELAAKHPEQYRFTTLSTGVKTYGYRSTSDTSRDVADAASMRRSQYIGPGQAPYQVMQNGGAQWIQLYKPDESNIDQAQQHAHAFWWGAGNSNLQHLLGWDQGNDGAQAAPAPGRTEAPTVAPKSDAVKPPPSSSKPSEKSPTMPKPTAPAGHSDLPVSPVIPLIGAPGIVPDSTPITQPENNEPIERIPPENTIFVGDSLMVGLAMTSNFSRGIKCYKGGMQTGWMLNELRKYFEKNPSGKTVVRKEFADRIKKVVIMGGINDISSEKSPAQVIDNLHQMYQLALDAGLKVIACTITYWDQAGGIKYFQKNYDKMHYGKYGTSAEDLKKRTEAVNAWIISQNNPSAGIIAVDTYNPTKNKEEYDRHGDPIHFQGTGYKRLAKLISSHGGVG